MAQLFVGQLPFNKFYPEDLVALFQPYGSVVHHELYIKRGNGFITYATTDEADAAIQALHGKRKVNNRAQPLQVMYSKGTRVMSLFGREHQLRCAKEREGRLVLDEAGGEKDSDSNEAMPNNSSSSNTNNTDSATRNKNSSSSIQGRNASNRATLATPISPAVIPAPFFIIQQQQQQHQQQHQQHQQMIFSPSFYVDPSRFALGANPASNSSSGTVDQTGQLAFAQQQQQMGTPLASPSPTVLYTATAAASVDQSMAATPGTNASNSHSTTNANSNNNVVVLTAHNSAERWAYHQMQNSSANSISNISNSNGTGGTGGGVVWGSQTLQFAPFPGASPQQFAAPPAAAAAGGGNFYYAQSHPSQGTTNSTNSNANHINSSSIQNIHNSSVSTFSLGSPPPAASLMSNSSYLLTTMATPSHSQHPLGVSSTGSSPLSVATGASLHTMQGGVTNINHVNNVNNTNGNANNTMQASGGPILYQLPNAMPLQQRQQQQSQQGNGAVPVSYTLSSVVPSVVQQQGSATSFSSAALANSPSSQSNRSTKHANNQSPSANTSNNMNNGGSPSTNVAAVPSASSVPQNFIYFQLPSR